MPYRQLEGFIGLISAYEPGLSAADYITVVAVDSTGREVTNRGGWMRKKHGTQRRGWIKVHVAVDVESKRLLLEVQKKIPWIARHYALC